MKRLYFALATFAILIVGIPGVKLIQQVAAARAKTAMMDVTHAIAYRNSPYATAAFFAEQQAQSAALVYTGSETRWKGDYHGAYYTIVGGWRVTTDVPATYRHTVWLFGSSTIRDFYVPDWYTKASYLQRSFNAAGVHYRVQQRAIDGLSVTYYPDLLNEADVRPGDIVVFYGGFMAASADQFADVMRQGAATTKGRGAAFYAFLEPAAWTMPLSADEQALVANTILVASGSKERELPLWAAMGQRMQQLRTEGTAAYDLTHVLDDARRQGVGVYIDDGHTNEFGNVIIARAIFETITVF